MSFQFKFPEHLTLVTKKDLLKFQHANNLVSSKVKSLDLFFDN